MEISDIRSTLEKIEPEGTQITEGQPIPQSWGAEF